MQNAKRPAKDKSKTAANNAALAQGAQAIKKAATTATPKEETKKVVEVKSPSIIPALIAVIKLQADALWFRDKVKRLALPELNAAGTVMDKLVDNLNDVEAGYRKQVPAGPADEGVAKAVALREEWKAKLAKAA